MDTAITETRQVGGSLMVPIPKNLRKSLGLQKNQLVEITVRKAKPGAFGKFPDLPRFTQQDELQIE